MTDHELLNALLPRLPQIEASDIDLDPYPSVSITRSMGVSVYIEIEDGRWVITSEVPGHELQITTQPDDHDIQRLGRAILAAYAIPESDDWEPGEYGYTDSHFVGTETWEDQKQYDSVRRTRGLPDSWYVMKITRFDSQKLIQIMEWLKDNCVAKYERVGWSSGCSTTVGIAFENQHDAIMYTLRWK